MRFSVVISAVWLLALSALAQTTNQTYPLWDLAKKSEASHRFSTLFTAQDVRNFLGNETGLARALDWCKKTGVTRVFIEEYRDGYQADRAAILHAKEQFAAAGIPSSGCVTTTKVGKRSTGWGDEISCYTDQPTQQHLQTIFEYAASLFDEIMIDDFYFTDCACAQCEEARQSRTVKVDDKTFPVGGERWEDYRCELMLQVARERVLGPARRVNPNVKIILKYPQWYDLFQDRGYDVVRETAAFDKIWVGTETRDVNDRQWGGTPQYEGYFLMSWLGKIGGEKCGGGWYDFLGTTPATYLEQARQTILAGARETFLFHYGGLMNGHGPADVEALRKNMPDLLNVAEKIHGRSARGVAAYKPPNSHGEEEGRIFDFVGMCGIPLAPTPLFPKNAPAAFFSIHSLKDPSFATELAAYIKRKRPVLLTDGLVKRLGSQVDLNAPNIHVLAVAGKPSSLLTLSSDAIDRWRHPLLAGLQTTFEGPNKVALYEYEGSGWVVENFNDEPVHVELNGQSFDVPPREWKYHLP